MNNDVDQYAQQKSLFGDEPAAPHPKGFREELHAREKDNIPNPNRHPGQFAPKGGSNPLLKVVEHEHGWTASAVLKDGKEFRVEGKDRREAIGNAVRAGEKMGVIFDPPAAEPKIGGLFGGSFDEKAHPREQKNHDGKQAGQFAPKQQAEEAPFVLQRPKKNTTVPTFGSNANTKQSALFDVGKKNELPGQELLFNSDAGDQHNPKTMENRAKVAETPEETKPELTSNRLEVLKGSLEKKEKKLDDKFNAHFDDVARANGQPLNDKRNGQATLSRWDKQSDSIRNAQKEIEKTKQAIERETEKIINVSSEKIPGFLSDMVKSGELNQWRKYPNTFFVPGVDKGRIVWNEEGQFLANRYLSEVPKDQYPKFRDVFNKLNAILKESKVATSESKSQPDPMAIAQEALSNNENIGITMGRHGVTIKGHPDYRTIRQQVSKHLEELQEQAKPQPSPARQRAMDAQIRNRVDNPADNYSHRVYGQFEEEAERYFRDYTLYDVDRYGMGGGIMKLILSMMAMHAMSGMINKQSQARQQRQKPSAAAPTTPSNQDFEKLHPRAQTQSGNSKPGQFAKKPEGSAPTQPPQPREARPLTERPDKKTQLSQAPSTQQQQSREQAQAWQDFASKTQIWNPNYNPQSQQESAQEQEQPAPVTPKPWLAEPGSPKPDVTAYDLDPRRGTPEQKAAAIQSRMDRDNGVPQQPVQTPSDSNTARIAEIWHGKESGQADDFGAGVDDPPQVQPQQPQPLKTEPAAPNPRKKTLGDGMTPNPAYNPQQIEPKPIPAKPPRQKPEKAPKPEKEPKPEKPSLLDREVSDTGSNADIFENPAAKARREKAELDRITKFDVSDFAEPEGEEEFAGGEEFDIPAPTEEEFDTPEQLQKMQDYRARRPASEDPQELAAWRKTKPETFESATQKWNAKRYRLNSKNKKAVQDDPEENIYQVAEQNEFLPEQFKSHIDEMQRHEQGEWERREKVKSSILKAWNTDRSTLKRMENRNQDHSNLLGADQLKGSVADSDLYEFLGSDDGEWAQNAWAMVREDTPPRPGAHDKDWLNGHAENFKRMQAMPEPDTEWYPEPEDDMPFSRKSLTREIDRYFQQHLARIRATRAKTESQSWTDLDSWL